MKTSEAFRLTKDRLWQGYHPMFQRESTTVCGASFEAGTEAYAIVGPIIYSLIKPHLYLGAWLWANHGISTIGNSVMYQQTRHAWVDHLIQHYESIGD